MMKSAIMDLDMQAFLQSKPKFEGGAETNFLKFFIVLESELVAHPWVFENHILDDPTETFTMLSSDSNYYRAKQSHSAETKDALDAIKTFKSHLGDEPLSLVMDILGDIAISPRKRLTRSLSALESYYTRSVSESDTSLKKFLQNIPPIFSHNDIDTLLTTILFIVRHIKCLDKFFLPRTGVSCRIPESFLVSLLVDKLSGQAFVTARERIQQKIDALAEEQADWAERLRDFHSKYGRSADAAGAESDDEEKDISTLHAENVAGRPAPRMLRGVLQLSSSTRFSAPVTPGFGRGSAGGSRSPSGFYGVRGSSPPRYTSSGGRSSPNQELERRLAYAETENAIREAAKERRRQRILTYNSELAKVREPKKGCDFAEATKVLRDCVAVHRRSNLHDQQAIISPSVFASRVSSESPGESRGQLRERSASPEVRGHRSAGARDSHNGDSKRRALDMVQLCHEWMRGGNCRRGGACHFSHPPGIVRQRSQSPQRSSTNVFRRSSSPYRANAAVAEYGFVPVTYGGEDCSATGGGGGTCGGEHA